MFRLWGERLTWRSKSGGSLNFYIVVTTPLCYGAHEALGITAEQARTRI
jgi:hypothetical protein